MQRNRRDFSAVVTPLFSLEIIYFVWFFPLLWRGLGINFEIWCWRSIDLWSKYSRWINITSNKVELQECVQWKEKEEKYVTFPAFGLCFDICTNKSESHLQQDRKMFLAYDSSILLSFYNSQEFFYSALLKYILHVCMAVCRLLKINISHISICMIYTYFVVQDVLTEIKRSQHSRRRCAILQVQSSYLYLTPFLASVFWFLTAPVPHKTIITSQASFLQALTLQALWDCSK